MKMSVKMTGNQAVIQLSKKVKNMDNRKALEDCVTIFENSTKAGYVMQTDPGGQKWAKNPEWWQKMKGHTTPLTGVTSGGVSNPSPPWKIKGNRLHMKNQLTHSVTSKKGTIWYKGGKIVDKRAKATQEGGEYAMNVFHMLKPKIKAIWIVDIQAREHLGIAERFKRVGGKTDTEHFEDIFVGHIDKALRKVGM